MTEKWKPIKGFENIYEISNLGNVKSLSRITNNQHKEYETTEKMLSPAKDRGGYLYVYLTGKNQKAKFMYIHRFVAIHFVGNLEEKNFVNHKDGNKINNVFSNLEWVSKSENTKHAYSNNLMGVGINLMLGEKNKSSKLTEKEVLEIRELHKQGMNCLTISKQYSVNNSTIDRILKRITWKHI